MPSSKATWRVTIVCPIKGQAIKVNNITVSGTENCWSVFIPIQGVRSQSNIVKLVWLRLFSRHGKILKRYFAQQKCINGELHTVRSYYIPLSLSTKLCLWELSERGFTQTTIVSIIVFTFVCSQIRMVSGAWESNTSWSSDHGLRLDWVYGS